MFALRRLPAILALLSLSFVGGVPFLGALDAKPLPGSWTDALSLATLPDGSLLVAQRSGLVDRLAPDGNGFRPPEVWADLGDNGHSDLLGFTVDPDFFSSGYVYAVLRTVVDRTPVAHLTRWRDSAGLVVLNKVMSENLPSGPDRAGGVVKFGPDGHLWVGIGDGGAPAAEVTPANLRGVLLRYNADGTVPEDNALPGSPVWAWGFRDPGAITWQPATGKLFVLDRGPAVAQGTNDPVDIVTKGDNFGWPKYMARDYGRGTTPPLTYCSSGHSWVPNGATFVTTGDWDGSLLFVGSGKGNLIRLTLTNKTPPKLTFEDEVYTGELGALMDVLPAPDGTVFLLSREKLYRIIP
jgi:glucose/arabinose dehydrogenase